MQPTREAFFEILVREHELALLAFVRSAIDEPTAAEDILQESFVAAWLSIAEYDERRPFAAWLRGIASNKILEHYRNHATDQRHVRMLPLETIEAISHQFDQLIPGRGDVLPETMAALRHCLSELSAQDREIVERIYRQEDTCQVIAATIGQGIERIKKRLQRARAKLRDCIVRQLAKGAANG